MEIDYEIESLKTLEQRLFNLMNQPKLKELGIRTTTLCQTTYGYKINMISIGRGKKEIFIVGGTHSSEIITTDFTTQLIKQLPNIKEYDPNQITLHVIPLQNPEGFDLSTQTFSHIQESVFEEKSKEYYLRYKTDSLIVKALEALNQIKKDEYYLTNLKQFIRTNKHWIILSDKKTMPNIEILNKKIEKANSYIEVLYAYRQTINELNDNDIHDIFLIHFINILLNDEIDINKIPKLYQKMFENINIQNLNIRSKKMQEKMVERYKLNPQGSQIGHDSTGQFINLNANHLLSPGIEIIRTKKVKYMTGTKSNIRNYIPGPNGLPCTDIDNFEYAIENKVLYHLLKESYKRGTYLATLLYHGTGGMIYYLPHQELMGNDYYEFLKYNKALTEIYNEGIQNYGTKPYKLINESETTGYGDLLARTFPGVLLIELSRMGGNPIGPYGDKFNIYNTINENISAVINVLKYFKKY